MDPSAPTLPPELREIQRHLPAGEAWLVGGAVRDLLLGRPLKDLDLAVPRGSLEFARELSGRLQGAFVPLDPERGVARVVWERGAERRELDVADFRAEGGLEADLLARDVTINAMALSIAEPVRLVDPAGGREDVERRIVRLLGPQVLEDDPVRSLRAVRLVAQLGFRLDEASAGWIAARAGTLAGVAGERARDELWKCLVAPDPRRTLRLLEQLGLLAVTVPETLAARGEEQSAPHRHDVWEHTLAVVDRVARVSEIVARVAANPSAAAPGALGGAAGDRQGDGEPIPPDLPAALAPFAAALAARLARPLAADRAASGHLLLAALFHDLGKPITRSVGEDGRIHFYGHAEAGARLAETRLLALRFAADEVAWVARMVRHHMRPLQLKGAEPLSRRAIHRFHRAAGPVAPELCLLSIGDNLAKGGVRTRQEWPQFLPRVVELLDAYFNRYEELVAPPRLLDGDEVVALAGRPAGEWVGKALRDLAEAQAVGRVADRATAEGWVRRWARMHHAPPVVPSDARDLRNPPAAATVATPRREDEP